MSDSSTRPNEAGDEPTIAVQQEVLFGGEPLLAPDQNFELMALIERTMDISDINILKCAADTDASGRRRPRNWELGDRNESRFQAHNVGGGWQSEKFRVGLCSPTWPQSPAPKINTLTIPTGASRWSEGYFLCDSDFLGRARR